MIISLVASNSTGGNGTVATTPALKTTGANVIVAAIAWATAGTQPGLTDSQGNTWILLSSKTSDYLANDLYYCANPTTSAAHTFTATGNASSAPTISVAAFKDAPDCSPAAVTLADVDQTSAGFSRLFGQILITAISTVGTSNAMAGFASATTDFISGQTLGGGLAWSIKQRPDAQTPSWTWTGTGNYAAQALCFLPARWQRIQSTPVIPNHTQGGADVDGIQPDAYAAPGGCWDGSRWAVTASLWNIATSKWYSAFFTGPDLLTLAYVSGSLQSPAGTDYIIGNGDIKWFNGKYWWAYNHYPSASGPTGVTIAHSTDLKTWTVVQDPIPGNTYGADPQLVVNPTTGNLECWAMVNGTPRQVVSTSSSDGITWSAWSAPYAAITAPGATFGEPAVWYDRNGAYMTSDMTATSGGRVSALFYGPFDTPTSFADANEPEPSNAWEASQVFDLAPLGLVNRKDGRGSVWWALYAGGDNTSSTDDTDSSIGIVFLAPPVVNSLPPQLLQQRVA